MLIDFSLKSKNSFYAFAFGGSFVILFCSMPASADAGVLVKVSQKALAKRISNAISCGAINLGCSKAGSAKTIEIVVTKAATSRNPQLIAAFVCGATLAWCGKYVIFDK